MSRLDSCNSTLWGLPANQLIRLQKTQNAAAHIVTRTKSLEHITPALRGLQWLPVSKRIEYRILCLTYQFVLKIAPHYLQELVSLMQSPLSLHTSLCADWTSLDLARTQLKTNQSINKYIQVQEQGYSAMQRPPSGTGCQTSFTKQKTLLLFGGSWNHICFLLYVLPPPLPSSGSPHPPPSPHDFLHWSPTATPPSPVHLLCQAQQACRFLQSQTVMHK